MRLLSSYLSNQAELNHERRIPTEVKQFIAQVRAAEQQQLRDMTPLEMRRADLYRAIGEAYELATVAILFEEIDHKQASNEALRESRRDAYKDLIDALQAVERSAAVMKVDVHNALVKMGEKR